MRPPQAEFEQSIDDARAFFANALPRSRAAKNQKWTIAVVSPIAVIAGGLILCYIAGAGFPPPGSWLLWIGLAALLTMYFAPSTTFKQQMKQVTRMYESPEYRKRLGATKIELRPDGVAAASPIGATIIDWKAITQVIATTDYVFLHVDELSALIVPRRAFASDSDFDRFADAANLYHLNSRE